MAWIKASVPNAWGDYNLAWYNPATGESRPLVDMWGNELPQPVAPAPAPAPYVPAAPEGSMEQAFAAQAPIPAAPQPVAPQLLNAGAGVGQDLMAINPATGQPAPVSIDYGTQSDPFNMTPLGYYFSGDANAPATASQATAGGYSVDNGTTGLGSFLEPLVIGGLGAIAGAPVAAAAGGGVLGGAAGGATGGAVSGGIGSGGDLEAMLKGAAIGAGIGGGIGAITGPTTPATVEQIMDPGTFYTEGAGAFQSPSLDSLANSGMDFGGPGVGWSPDTITGATPTIAPEPVAQSFPVSQPTPLQELLAQAPTITTDVTAPTLGVPQMPPAVPEPDPTFGGTLTQTGPGQYENVGNILNFGTPGSTLPSGTPPGLDIQSPAATGATMPPAESPASTASVVSPTTTAAAAGAGIGATKISDILNGNVGVGDLAGMFTLGNLGNLLGTAASVYGANEQANKLKAMYDQYLSLGAPSRQRYEASFQPGFDITGDPVFKSAMDASTDALLRRGSVGGNPFGNPGVLAEIQKYTTSNVALPYLQNYRNQNAATGGYNAFNTAAPGTGGAAVQAGGEVYSDIGRGIGRIMNPQPTLQDFFNQSRMGSLP